MPEISFPIADVQVPAEAKEPLDSRSAVEGVVHRRLEAMGLEDQRLICCNDHHAFGQAAHDAFFNHYPLTITPDDIWFCIAQAFSHYVNLNAESLGHRFVSHSGKKKLLVERQDFRLGEENPWPEVFTAFSDQIAAQVGNNLRELIVADFSTTRPVHRAATEVVLMETFQPYFEYEMLFGCGIPQIRLKGAPDDWRNIRRRASMLAEYGLADWIKILMPILDKIEESSRGHVDADFWKSFFRYRSGSGGSDMTGWLQVLFPYLRNYRDLKGPLIPNAYIKNWETEYWSVTKDVESGKHPEYSKERGPYLGELPASVASAPVKMIDGHKNVEHNMRFVAGMFGVAQDEATRSLQASFGWAIAYDDEHLVQALKRRRGLFRR